MKLSPVFSDGMILQRDVENRIAGCAPAGSRIILCVDKMQAECRADKDGHFCLTLPPHPAGSGITFCFKEYADGAEQPTAECCISDAAFGDVFLLSGQSNMELPVVRTLDVTEDVVRASDYPFIREFAVPMEYDFNAPKEEVAESEWKYAQGEPLLQFSAAGFFMARELYEKYRVPIGLVRAAIGGTPIQAWCSEKTIRELSDYVPELEKCREEGYVESVQKKEEKEQQAWYEEAGVFPEGAISADGWINVPGMWQDTALSDFHGSLILEKSFDFEASKEELSSKTARIYLGAIVDADKVYVNGFPVGETGYRYPPRKYDFPAKYLKNGKNHIRIEMYVFRNTGGFIPDKPYYVGFDDREVSLAGAWKYQLVKPMPVLDDTTFFYYKATGLYNGMLAPLKGHSFKGMTFYQGESNTHHPEEYSAYFEKAVSDWRVLFGEKLPLVTVELAGFADSKRPCTGTNWAVLRNEQRKALSIENTAMVSARDIGEYNDLHPQNKLTLGKRIALAMEKLAYGEKVVSCDYMYKGMQVNGRQVRISFETEGSALKLSGTKEKLTGIELAGEYGVFYPADAWIEENGVLAECEQVVKPARCRYAWNDNPEDANLCNEEGFPAACFISK